jgi:SAM-dependent methyltransferase
VSATNYEALAEEYARHRRVHPGVLRELIEFAKLNAESRVLEVGCGTGNYLLAIKEQAGCTAIGVDPSEAMLAHAKERSSDAAWLIGRAEALPVPNQSLDLIFSVDVIHHVGDRAAFFAEADRALKPGGLICTATDSHEDILRRRPLSSHFPETIEVELTRYPAAAVLRLEMTGAGLEVLPDGHVELEYPLTQIAGYRDRAYSSLHLIDQAAFERGIARLEAELAAGPIPTLSLYTLLWGRRT